jgi:tetratricopeptide (TPR) repeat protein
MSGSDQGLSARERAALEDLRAAHAHHQAGDLDRAEAGYRRVLKREPEHPGALNLLGLIAAARGALDDAERLLGRAIRALPTMATAYMDLGTVLGRLGRPAEAEEKYREAIRRDPELAAAYVNLAMLLNERGAHAEAAAECRTAVKLSSGLMEAHLVLAGSLRALGDIPAAEQAYRMAIALRPDRAETLSDLATMLGEARRFGEAMERHRRALALRPESAVLHRARASTLERMGDLAGAELAYGQAIMRSPLDLTSWISRGACLAGLGRFAEADGCFTRVLGADPNSTEAYWMRARIRTLPAEAEAPLRAALADPALPPMRQVCAGFALGSLLDGLARPEEALAIFTEANARFRALRADETFDAAAFDTAIDSLIAATPAELFPSAAADMASDLPVFIVGMPRSGISLVEHIAASHTQVHGAGPLHRMTTINLALAQENEGKASLADWDAAGNQKAARAHLASLAALGAGKARVIDSTPDNILLLGLIATLFPQARVVVCQRDVRDLCLSNFFTLFTEGNPFSRDLADCARRAAAQDRLLAHWRAVLPLRFHVMQYEALVADPETESRRLIDFLGLEWDAACLNFQQTERPITTAPVWEVRQPIFSGGVGRWKPYAKGFPDG